MRCQFTAQDDLACAPCKSRGKICRDQDFADDSEASQLSMRHLAQRLSRLEELMGKLAERVALDPSPNLLTGLSTKILTSLSSVAANGVKQGVISTSRDPSDSTARYGLSQKEDGSSKPLSFTHNQAHEAYLGLGLPGDLTR
ncbi:hypothetical protein BFJ63_vAg11708 [Fusarium oxysporum f. sp. narcissi]|uniref:Zn(2)-C6 fungal-type domain-containing protein n=6 Tax=Fusarium oxysporum TaxID=5507 RepID=A0A420R569_FUSOX|nr:hypothetical protein FOXG_20834 [Fusarium oxysporum f. sp. lycopersici 4287]XP_018251571.1 hypothetical protein FOXG_20834 [Fusarium oxysporum f. sp. lycopersici 4287]XP_018251572.1 hypothetical protein FOXG_20834 [Fusarium oxysporum f. sp. lycopersici 4287]XP_018251573.1 hypothetical protein FOXG_20834 [Fusarium oxysporum f. sp. lycopersici 4287]XP_059467787.1 uncharacterized protein FOBCDRAFT_297692 [Fusarium oxysporum Fo47]EWZ94164.1 hypothetical protein FOWG_04535 [Fusarium oxysporum f.